MNVGHVLVSTISGVLVALVVGVAATELLLDVVWPSLIVGIPVGVLAGVVTFAGALYYLDSR